MGKLDEPFPEKPRSSEWSLGTEERHIGAGAANANPGPGSYGHEGAGINEGGIGSGAPAYAFGKGVGHDGADSMSLAPGPGTYDTAGSTLGGPGVPFGKENRMEGMTTIGPGPGGHSPELGGPSAPAYSIGGGPKILDRGADTGPDGPGPGTYSPPYAGHRAAAYSIGLGTRDEKGPESGEPGPGHYDSTAVDKTKCCSGASYSIAGKYGGGAAAPVAGPGPGAHTPGFTSCHTAPAYSMGGGSTRPTKIPPSHTPGPGRYSASDWASYQSPAYSIPGAPSPSRATPKSNVPGPQTYDRPLNNKTRAPAYSIASKPAPKKEGPHPSRAPGPGSHTPKLDSAYYKSPAFSISAARTAPAEVHNDRSPGPGSYNPSGWRAAKHTAAAFSMGPPPLRAGSKVAADRSPGPGAYDQQINAFKYRAPGYSMGRPKTAGPRRELSRTPGPGEHDIILDAAKYKSPAFSMGRPKSAKPKAGPKPRERSPERWFPVRRGERMQCAEAREVVSAETVVST